MPKRKPKAESPPRFLPLLEAAAGALVDHRLLLQVALVLIVALAITTWGPDEVRHGVNVVIESAPVQLMARAVFKATGIAVGLSTAPQATGAMPPSGDAAGSVRGTPAPRGGVVPAAGAAPPQGAPQGPAIKQPLPRGGISDAPKDGSRRTGAANEESPDGVLWSLEKDGEIIRAVVQDRGSAGVDLQLFRNGRLWRSERWADREAARNGAQTQRANLEKQGWTPRLARDPQSG